MEAPTEEQVKARRVQLFILLLMMVMILLPLALFLRHGR